MGSHNLAVVSLAFSPDGKFLASGGVDFTNDNTLKLWDVKNGSTIWIGTHNHDVIVNCLSYSPDKEDHEEIVNCLSYSPDGKFLASGSRDNTIKFWDVKKGSIIWVGLHNEAVKSVAFSPAGKLLASGSEDGKIKLWDVKTSRDLLKLVKDQ